MFEALMLETKILEYQEDINKLLDDICQSDDKKSDIKQAYNCFIQYTMFKIGLADRNFNKDERNVLKNLIIKSGYDMIKIFTKEKCLSQNSFPSSFDEIKNFDNPEEISNLHKEIDLSLYEIIDTTLAPAFAKYHYKNFPSKRFELDNITAQIINYTAQIMYCFSELDGKKTPDELEALREMLNSKLISKIIEKYNIISS